MVRHVTAFMALVCLSMFAFAHPAEAEPEDEVVHTQEVVVSATKTAVPMNQVTSAVEVITGQELQDKKVKTVFDALRLAQGVTAFQSGGPGTIGTVQMRGTKSSHTMVLIDGAIVNSPTTGLFDFSSLTSDNIERIEILRGAQSMLYGSDAMGGVINIITKKGTGTPTVSGFIEYGSFATLREGMNASGAKGPFDFSVAVSRWDTSSYSAINHERGATERDGYHNWQASAKLGAALPKDGRLEFGLRWWNSDVHFDGFAFDNNPADHFGNKLTNRQLILNGSYEQPITSWWTQKLTVARANERLLGRNGPSGRNVVTNEFLSPSPNCVSFTSECFFPFTTDIESINQRLEWQNNFQITKYALVTAGYQFREERGDSTSNFGGDAPKRLISSHAGFAQAQFNVNDRLFATAGIRQDRYNAFGDTTTYRVTGGYLIPETGTKFRASYATGFKAPTLNDLYFQNANNPALRPEKSQSLDAGVDQSFFHDRLTLNAGYFWNHYRDLIQFVSTFTPQCPASTFGFCPINIAQARTQGWEFGFKANLMRGLDLKGQYTLTHTRDLTTGRRLPRWPIDQASIGVSYRPIDQLTLNMDYRLVGARNNNVANSPEQKQGAFGIVNLAGSYDVAKHTQVFMRIENLFNQKYEEILYFGGPIRAIFGGVKLTY